MISSLLRKAQFIVLTSQDSGVAFFSITFSQTRCVHGDKAVVAFLLEHSKIRLKDKISRSVGDWLAEGS